MAEEKKRLLIIDDEMIHRIGLRDRLEAAGYEVHSAEGGKEAMALVQHMSFVLITLDLLMPPPDGFEVFKFLRDLPATQSTPILLLTAVGLEPEVQELLNQGRTSYIRKQDAPRKIVHTVQQLLEDAYR